MALSATIGGDLKSL